MQLALDLGKTLEQLNNEMTAKEFTLWSQLHQMQPRGVERDNYHTATICTLLANINAPKGKRYQISDFMHKDPETENNNKVQNFLAKLRTIAKPKSKKSK